MRPLTFKTIISYTPEAGFIIMALYWFIDNLMASQVNYYMLAILAFVAFLIYSRKKVLAIILSALLALGSFYMLLAVISEFREFSAGDSNGIKLLLTGSTIFMVLMFMAILLPRKYSSITK